MSNLILARYFKNTTATNIRNSLVNITKEGEVCEWECTEKSKAGEIIPITGFNGFRLKFRTTNKSNQLVVSNPDLYIRSGGMYGLGFRNLHCVGNCVTKDNVSSKIEFDINIGGELEYTPKKTITSCKIGPCGNNGGCIMKNNITEGVATELCCFDGSGGTGCNTSENLCGIDGTATLCGRHIDKCGSTPVAGSVKGIFLLLYKFGLEGAYPIPWVHCGNQPLEGCNIVQCLSNGIDKWLDNASHQIIIMFAGAALRASDGYWEIQKISPLAGNFVQTKNRDVYMSIGGAAGGWGQAEKNAYTDSWIEKNVIANKYSGVCFDLEGIGDISVKQFVNMFKITKKNNLKVMVTISYFGGGNQQLNNQNETYAKLATSCLQGDASEVVDIFSPQLYGGNCDDPWPFGSGRDWIGLTEEQQNDYVNINPNVKLMPAINSSNSDNYYDKGWDTLSIQHSSAKPDKPSGYIQYCYKYGPVNTSGNSCIS